MNISKLPKMPVIQDLPERPEVSIEYENFEDEPKPTKMGMTVFAILSKISYASGSERTKELKDFKLNKQFIILNEYSNNNILTVKDKKSKNVICAVRGTNPRNVSDLVEDAIITVGSQDSERLREIEGIVEKVVKKYGKDNITITGHSLGAHLATTISDDLDIKAVVFNVGSSPLDSRGFRSSEKIKHYTTNRPFTGEIDPLSISSVLKDSYDTIRVKRKPNVPIHSIDNFVPELPKKPDRTKVNLNSIRPVVMNGLSKKPNTTNTSLNSIRPVVRNTTTPSLGYIRPIVIRG